MTFVDYWFLSWLLSFKKISWCCLCLFLLLWTLLKSLLTNSNHLTSFTLSSKWASVKVKVLVTKSCLFATPWTLVHQAPLFMEYSRQEYWSEWPFSFPGDLPNSDCTWVSCIAGRFFTVWATRYLAWASETDMTIFTM